MTMLPTLENQHFQLALDLSGACWHLYPPSENTFSLEGIRMGVTYRRGGRRFHTLGLWPAPQVSEVEDQSSSLGLLHQLTLMVGPDSNGLLYHLTFALPYHQPLFLWKMNLRNEGPDSIFLDRLTLLDSSLSCKLCRAPESSSTLAFYSNGWQSWSYAGVYSSNDRFHHTRLGPLRIPIDVNAGTPLPNQRGHFASDMFGVLGDRQTRRALLAGFLSQQKHFGSLETWLNTRRPRLHLWANGDGARLDPFTTLSTDWACLYFLDLDSPDPLSPYLSAVFLQNRPSPISGPQSFPANPQNEIQDSKPEIPTGWCSWYQFSSEEDYTGSVTARDILENLHAISQLRSELPLDVIQIDDGFESQIGDWLSFSSGFPQGVAPLADEIRRTGFTPGLWLAPFIVHPMSRLFSDHPHWLLRGRFNRPLNAGYLWSAFTTALDLTHPDALNYVREVVHTAVHCWGFPYLKLDFLYAAALPGHYSDQTLTRAQVLRTGLRTIRDAAGEETFLLGCGCPLGPAIGLIDAMRISADVARRWKPSFKGIETFFEAEQSFPSARNAIHNSLARAPLHHRWWVNDPDCLLVRTDTHLTLVEVQTLATVISLTGGSLLLSDHLPALPPERLRLVQSLLPPLGLRPWLLDWFDTTTPRRLRLDLESPAGFYHLLAFFNWGEKPQDYSISLEDYNLSCSLDYLARDFWRSEIYLLSNGVLDFSSVPPHGVVLLAVRLLNPSQPQYLGSDLHISQGLELTEWRFSPPASLTFCLDRPGLARGCFDLYLPSPPRLALLDDLPLPWQSLFHDCYRFTVEFTRTAEIDISW